MIKIEGDTYAIFFQTARLYQEDYKKLVFLKKDDAFYIYKR